MIILFDLDGTLIDSTEAIVESFHHAFEIYNYPHPQDEEISSLVGYPLDIMFAQLGVEQSKVWDFVDRYRENYTKISKEKTFLLKNTKEAIFQAKEFATLGIVTTKTAAHSRILMEHFSLMQHFDVLIGREDVEKPKPDAEPILKALLRLNLDDNDIWMIGDTKLDLISAKSANVNSIGVLSGYDEYDALKEHTNVIFSDVLEAAQYLKNK